MEGTDTICAVSTPRGEGGIGILRLSGPDAHRILKNLFRTKKGGGDFESHRLYFGIILDPEDARAVDEVYAVFLMAPRTYTREDVGEVYSHGGFAVQQKILSLMISAGARLAEPGEFTRRAFMNGRIDLAQAESVLDVIESETDQELRHAMGNLRGALSARIRAIRERLRDALGETEALIDFPEEDVDVDEEAIGAAIDAAREELQSLTASYYEGNAIRHGLEVLIVGRTNAGKSSLLNGLMERERAIVTPVPGTTRDLIEDVIHIKGIKARLVDTAGMGHARDPVEEEGMERVRRRIPEADLILWLLDGSRSWSGEDEDLWALISGRPVMAILNKSDLPRAIDEGALEARGLAPLSISALTGEGLDTLKDALYDRLMAGAVKGNTLLVTNLRHYTALSRASEALRRAAMVRAAGEPAEFIAADLREALTLLGEILGETVTEDILHDIFSRFCIGK